MDANTNEGKTLFECIYCRSLFSLDFKPPKKWKVSRYAVKDHFKYLCTKCGAFIYPCGLIAAGRSPDEQIFLMFSHCINAYQCYLHDQYSPDCEKEVLRPNCLLVIRRELEGISDRLVKLEKRLLDKQPGQSSHPRGKKSDKGLN